MSTKKEETASFVLRFTQKIFTDTDEQPQVQWRGHIRHVQSGEEKRFSEFEEVARFIQTKLADLTIQAMEDKSPEEQKGILSKSFDLWKKMAFDAPRMVIDTLKDPKKQVAQFQSQITQIGDVIEEKIGQKLDIDEWRAASKADYQQLLERLDQMTSAIEQLNKKVEKLSKKAK
ncbi:MAG: hypothetical protein D6714_14730 [Bacteroidetes bacterium]|nr:MAG: hypothetical protein D6714_14730 [Bacteroidota bacterium]